MIKTKTYTICDRCKKESETKTIGYRIWKYDLCEKCLEDFNKMKLDIEDIEFQHDNIEKKYKFGSYLPTDEEDKNE